MTLGADILRRPLEDRTKATFAKPGCEHRRVEGVICKLRAVRFKRVAARDGGAIEGEKAASAVSEGEAGVPVFARADEGGGRGREQVVQGDGRDELVVGGDEI